MIHARLTWAFKIIHGSSEIAQLVKHLWRQHEDFWISSTHVNAEQAQQCDYDHSAQEMELVDSGKLTRPTESNWWALARFKWEILLQYMKWKMIEKPATNLWSHYTPTHIIPTYVQAHMYIYMSTGHKIKKQHSKLMLCNSIFMRYL